jgi:hypothetical protein
MIDPLGVGKTLIFYMVNECPADVSLIEQRTIPLEYWDKIIAVLSRFCVLKGVQPHSL